MNDASIIKAVECVDLATWSDDRRREFADTFAKRVLASRYILVQAASHIIQSAQNRGFLSYKHQVNIPQVVGDDGTCWSKVHGGRSTSELDEIAKVKGAQVLSELPTLQDALRVIAPDVAEAIDNKKALDAKIKKLGSQLSELSNPKPLSDYDQKMTVAQLRASLKADAAKRKRLVLEMDELAAEAYELQMFIGRKTQAGVPKLAKAIVASAQQLIDKCNALDQVSRRVHEKIMFGDSKEAMELLRSFEQDEAVVSDQVHGQLREAVAALGIKLKTRKSGRRAAKKGAAK